MWDTLKNYLTQKSTYLGILKVLTTTGILTLAPEAESQAVNYAVDIAAGIVGIWGLYSILRNERKKPE